MTEYPATSTLPEVGVESVARIRTVVDFPAPFGPRSPKISPRSILWTRRPTDFAEPGYVFVRLCILIIVLINALYHASYSVPLWPPSLGPSSLCPQLVPYSDGILRSRDRAQCWRIME